MPSASTVTHIASRATVEAHKAALESDGGGGNDGGMSAITRDEMNARLEASEARASTTMETMRADLREGLSMIRVDIEKVRSDSHKASLDITRWIMATVVTIGLGFVGLILTGAGIYLRYLATQG